MNTAIARKETATTDSLVSSSPTPTQPAPPSAKADLDADLAQIVDEVTAQIRQCQAMSLAWLIKAGEHFRSCRRQLPHGDWTTIFASRRLPVGQRSAQLLARIARNKALCNTSLLQRLPQNLAVLVALAGLDSRLIEEGIRDGTIHRSLTVKAARALVRKHRGDQTAGVSRTSAPTRL